MLSRIDDFKRSTSAGQKLNTTMDVFNASWGFDATDPRDKFYGLLGLVQGQRFAIEPDYELPPAKLFTDMSAVSIIEENSFASLSFADPFFLCENEEDDGQPSWVPQWSSLSRRRIPFAYDGSYDLLNAANKIPERLTPHRPPKICNNRRILFVDAVNVDEIEVLGQPQKYQPPSNTNDTSLVDDLLLRMVDILDWIKECEDIVKSASPHAQASTGLEPFWHTITFNGLREGALSLSEIMSTDTYVKDCRSFLRMMMDDPSSVDPTLYESIQERGFTNLRFQICISTWRPRRLFGMTRNGYRGMFPEGATNGDVVCVILGARTSFVIRPEHGGTYRFVGEAYVHGLMNGEVFDLPNFEELQKETKLR